MSTIVPKAAKSPAVDCDLTEWVPPARSLARLSVEQYEAIVRAGVFDKRDRLQLINGILVAKMTENPPHAVASTILSETMFGLVPSGWHLRIDKPLRVPRRKSVPEPDRVVTRGGARDYVERHPGPGDVTLVVEIADSSLHEDRELARVYGRGGIPIYWIVNLVDRMVEVYKDPNPSAGYATREDFTTGQSVPVMIAGVRIGTIAVADILPPRRP
jgi:Uma2 family endonuclease